MNMIKKNGGFTLVELIVVIAILAILAGIAVPAYSGYIKKANDAAILSELSAVLTAVQASTATGAEITKIVVSNQGAVTIFKTGTTEGDTSVTLPSSFADFYGSSTVSVTWTGTSYENGATWTASNGWNPTPAST